MNVPMCIKLCDNIIVCACAVTVRISSGLHSNTLLLQPVTPKLLMELCVQLAEAMKYLECFRIIHPDLQLHANLLASHI